MTFTWNDRLSAWASGTISEIVAWQSSPSESSRAATCWPTSSPIASDSRTVATICIRVRSYIVRSVCPGLTVSPELTFLSMTTPAIGGMDRGIAQEDLGLLDRMLRSLELGLRRQIGRVRLLELLLGDGIDRTQPLGPLDVDPGLVQLRGGTRFRRLGLAETGLEIGVVEHDEFLLTSTVLPVGTVDSPDATPWPGLT